MERAAWLERRYGADIDWLPFDLHPEYPPEGVARRAGHGAGVRAMVEEAGLALAPAHERVPNGRNALVVAQLARERGGYAELRRRVFEAYWAEALDISDPDVLVPRAAAAGLDAGEVREAIATQRGLDDIHRQMRDAFALGASGVPAWAIDDRIAIPGAQPHELFERVLEKLGHVPV